MAPVPESVSRSISTSSEWMANRLKCTARIRRSRSLRLVIRIGSMTFIRKGSMIVFMYSWRQSVVTEHLGNRRYGIPVARGHRDAVEPVQCAEESDDLHVAPVQPDDKSLSS